MATRRERNVMILLSWNRIFDFMARNTFAIKWINCCFYLSGTPPTNANKIISSLSGRQHQTLYNCKWYLSIESQESQGNTQSWNIINLPEERMNVSSSHTLLKKKVITERTCPSVESNFDVSHEQFFLYYA